MIYVVWAKGTDYIKLGYTASYSMNLRLSQLQIGCPFELEVIAFADGSELDESAFHHMMTDAGLYVRGEWFKWGPVSHQIVQTLKAMPKPNPITKRKAGNPHRRLGAALSIKYGESVHES